MDNEIIVGLDIGTTKIACFVGVRSGEDKVKILGFGRSDSAGVENGVVRGITDASRAIQRAVELASDQSGVVIDEVYVGIAGQHIKSRPSQGSIMIPADHELITEEDVEHLVNDQYNTMLDPGEEIIHVFPQQFYVDSEPLSREMAPVGVAGRNLTADFHMVTGNVQQLKYIKMAVERAGLTIKGVVLEPVASSRAVLDDTDRDAGVAMVDIGGGTTDIALFHGGIIRHTSVLPLAGKAITHDIIDGCNIRPNQAESLKVKFGSCVVQAVPEKDVISIPGIRNQAPKEIYMRTLAGIINARTKMILEQVDYEIKLSGYAKKLIAGVVLTGGGAKLGNIKDLCELITATSTRIGIPDEHLDPDSVNYNELIHPMYATGIGLVLYGFDQSDEHKREQNEPAEEPERKQDRTKDIFADMDDIPAAPQPPTPQPATEQKKDKKKKEGDNFGRVVSRWFDQIFNERIDEK